MIATSTSALLPLQPAAKSSLSDRYILVQTRSAILVIPAGWVSEIFQIERSQILPLPFYNPSLIGLTHQGGRVLPLLSATGLLGSELEVLPEQIMVVKLSNTAGALAQVGLVVDRIVGSPTRADLPDAVFAESSQSACDEPMVLLRPEQVKSELWQPHCWKPSSSFKS